MNKKLLLRVADEIEKHPEHFDMDAYFMKSCNTTACIGGWAIFLAQKQTNLVEYAKTRPSSGLHKEAAEVLKLTPDQLERLFYIHHWKRSFAVKFINAVRLKTKAKIAAAYVRWFVENV
jgi:hypothetical protein